MEGGPGGGEGPPGCTQYTRTQSTYILTHPSWDRLALILAALASFDSSKATLSSSVKGLCAKRFACMHKSMKGGMEGGPGGGEGPPGCTRACTLVKEYCFDV